MSIRTKQCSKCKEWKDYSEFYNDIWSSNGISSSCKECDKENKRIYYQNNKEKVKERNKNYANIKKEEKRKYQKNYYQNNKERLAKKQSEYQKNNIDKFRKYNKKFYKNNKDKILYKNKRLYNKPINIKSKLCKEIELYEDAKESNDGNLMCKCAYCGEWFEPTRSQIKARLSSINTGCGECRLYCSQNCKNNCPIFYQMIYSKYQKPATSREVQPELRQMVFERDNYTCQRCDTHKDDLEVGIHCHHKEGILWEPLQSADMDMCVTLCEDCHKEVHSIDECGYNDLKCA